MGYKYNPFTGTLDLVNESQGGPTPSGNIKIESRVITLAEETNKELTLAETPLNANEVALDIPSGTSQILGTDFIIVGNVLSWDGFGLETLITENDSIRITYQF